MILKDLLNHFDIEVALPQYLLEHHFNEVFFDGNLTINNGSYKIEITTRQNVTHRMFIMLDEKYPVIILSVLPNGKQNGIKFGLNPGDEIPISKL